MVAGLRVQHEDKAMLVPFFIPVENKTGLVVSQEVLQLIALLPVEVLRRALWVQQAKPLAIFNWQFWERAAKDPEMTAYLTHGVKAKMCETTPFVNTVGAHYVASRAQLEQACDSLRQQGSSRVTTLLVPKAAIWSTMVMHTHPFTHDILQNVHPYHEVLLSCKPHRPGCHQWRPLQPHIHEDLKELMPDPSLTRL